MFCPNCGNQTPDNSAFCSKCGAKFQGATKTASAPKKPSKAPVIIAVSVVSVIILTAIIILILSFSKPEVKFDPDLAGTPVISTDYFEEVVSYEENVDLEEDIVSDVSEENFLSSMDTEEFKKLNVFLSNFSETSYRAPDLFRRGADEYMYFAYLHNYINNPKKVRAGDNFYAISVADANNTLSKYLGASISEEDVFNSNWSCDNGHFVSSFLDAKTFSYFSVATYMHDNNDGTYTVDFNVYFDNSGSNGTVPAENYYFDEQEAYDNCEYKYRGTATIKSKVYNGKDTYELVDYTTKE